MDTDNLKRLEKIYDVGILKVKIKGKRWGFDGNHIDDLPLGISKKIQLSDTDGVVVYNWEKLDKEKQADLESEIRFVEGSVE
jgi:hypothetical protein